MKATGRLRTSCARPMEAGEEGSARIAVSGTARRGSGMTARSLKEESHSHGSHSTLGRSSDQSSADIEA